MDTARYRVRPFGLVILLVLVVLSAHAQSTKDVSSPAIENVRLTDTSNGYPYQAEPTLTFDSKGRIFAGWKEMNLIGGYNHVGFGRSLDGGQTWSRSLVETGPGQDQSDPWLTVDESDRLYFARSQNPGVIVVSRSDDGGLTWAPAINIHDRPDSADKPSIKSDGNGTIYASYVTAGPTAPLNMKIIATRSIDGGVTWGPSRIVVSGLNPFASVIATRPNGTAHIVWWAPVSASRPGGNIKVSTSTDRGLTWGEPAQVNSTSGSALYNGNIGNPKRIPYPWVATNSSGTIFVAWADKGTTAIDNPDYNIVVARSDDGGATWSAPVQVNDVTTGDQWTAAITVDANDMLHAAWFDGRTGKINLFYANSTDGGRTWSPNLRVTDQESPSNTFSLGEYIGLAADRNGTAFLVWTDARDGGSAIYFARIECSPPDAPAAANNGPIRLGQTLELTASLVAGATYAWSGPADFHSSLQNPSIENVITANAGTYSVTVTVGGCTSTPATTIVAIANGGRVPGRRGH